MQHSFTISLDRLSVTLEGAPGVIPSSVDFTTALLMIGRLTISMSKLAQQRSKNGDILAFTRSEIVEQTNLAIELSACPDAVAPHGRLAAMLAALEDVPSPGFNQAFVRYQLECHTELRLLIATYLRVGCDDTLRKLAAASLPTIHHHHALLTNLRCRHEDDHSG